MTTTLDDLNALCTAIASQRKVVDEIAATKSEAQAKLDELEMKLVETLEAHGKTTEHNAAGRFTVVTEMKYRQPETEDSKDALYNYLKERGEFDRLASINYNTLNSWAKVENEAARDRGDFDFSIPGLGAPTIRKILRVTKPKD